MSWNYRVIRKVVEWQGETHHDYAIHEVYYDKEGNIEGWTVNPMTLSGYDDFRDLYGSIELMRKAFEKPVLVEYEEDGKEKLREITDLTQKGE